MLKAEYSYTEIARTINKDTSSVSRHARTNGGRERYDVREVKRKKRYARIEAMGTTRVLQGHLLHSVVCLLKEHYLPEQIAENLKRKSKVISTPTIYR